MTATLERSFAEVLGEVLGTTAPVDGHFFDDLGADSMLMARFCARVRKRADLPSVSMREVYQHPTVRALAAAVAPAPDPVEQAFSAVLGEVLGGEVPADAHFFDDLGADSMLMARFCARVRKRADLPSVSMRDVYAHPTVVALAAAVGGTAAPAAVAVPAAPPRPRAGTARYVCCGVLQLLLIVGYAYVLATAFTIGFDWISAGTGVLDVYLRAIVGGGAAFISACVVPILAKWLFVGRWKSQEIPIWSLAYVRFWLVKTLTVLNPLARFAGTPIYTLYLRALGAKVGRGALVLTRHVPVCADLLTVGAGTVIRNHTYLTCYRAEGGVIRTGTVTLGREVFVGEKSVLDIGTAMGDGAQLGHASSLHEGQTVPAGERWHGSPGQPTRSNYQQVERGVPGRRRMFTYTAAQMSLWLLVYVPLTSGGLAMLLDEVPALNALLEPGPQALASGTFLALTFVASVVLFTGGLLLSLVAALTLPRVLNRGLRPGRAYPLYGWRYSAHRTITILTNRRLFVELFGDSSAIVHYLRLLGYRLRPVVQTGSNFGSELVHENPYLCVVGRGTVIASGLHFLNADYSATSFRVTGARIGADNFLGNDIIYPPQGRTGDNCLLGTKVLVPIDGPLREGVGLLGSPAFEIPRSVERDNRFIAMAHRPDVPRRLMHKNRHNALTMAYWLMAKWGYTFGLTLLGLLAADLYAALGAVAIAAGEVLAATFTLFYVVLVERASTGFRGMAPKYCSIYEKGFWESERFFKMQAGPGLNAVFIGTPFQSWFWRLVGVRLGKRLFDDGGGMSEKNMVTLGDDVELNVGTFLQCHSQEDYAFKSDVIVIGSRCTIGVGATVHYGVTVGDDVVLAPESFLMKGEEVLPHTRWGGNPAREMPAIAPPAPVALDTVRRRRIRPVPVAAALVAVALPVGAVIALGVPDLRLPTTPVPQAPAPAAAVVPEPSGADVPEDVSDDDIDDDTDDDTDTTPTASTPVTPASEAAPAAGTTTTTTKAPAPAPRAGTTTPMGRTQG
jgi:non-ribosomal peptide synthetase-like protein